MTSFTMLATQQPTPSCPAMQQAKVVSSSLKSTPVSSSQSSIRTANLKEILVNPQAFKTPVIKTKEEVYVAADEVLTHPYFTPVHTTIYGSIAGAKAGLLVTPLVVGAAYLQEKLFPNQHFSFPFQDAILSGLDNLEQKSIRKAILEGTKTAKEYQLNPFQHVVKIGMTGLYTVGLSSLVFGGVVGLLIQANAQMKIAHIRRTIYNQNGNQTEDVPEDKLVGHFIHRHKKNEDPLIAYKNWSSDLSSPKDAAVNGFLSATTAKLITLVPKLAIGTILGLGIGAFQTIKQYKQFQRNEPFQIAGADFTVMFKVDQQAAEKVKVTSTTTNLRKETVYALEKAADLAQDRKGFGFFKERFMKQAATKAVTDSLLHLAAPAFWLSFLVVPPLVAIQLTHFFRNKIGIVPPNHYHHFHLTNWLKRWSYAKERSSAITAGKNASQPHKNPDNTQQPHKTLVVKPSTPSPQKNKQLTPST
ncbi:MAG: hypothetical protein H2174_03060 [Vampirovibrio sp.]|nr:hypothetical protein [Vampirovibrio sp.]